MHGKKPIEIMVYINQLAILLFQLDFSLSLHWYLLHNRLHVSSDKSWISKNYRYD